MIFHLGPQPELARSMMLQELELAVGTEAPTMVEAHKEELQYLTSLSMHSIPSVDVYHDQDQFLSETRMRL